MATRRESLIGSERQQDVRRPTVVRDDHWAAGAGPLDRAHIAVELPRRDHGHLDHLERRYVPTLPAAGRLAQPPRDRGPGRSTAVKRLASTSTDRSRAAEKSHRLNSTPR